MYMAWLPKNHTVEFYIDSCLTLLDSWQWLFREKATEILKTELLDKPPASDILLFLSNLSFQELKDVPHGLIKEEWPDELKDFVYRCKTLKLSIKPENLFIPNINKNLFRKMNPKKQEEVIRLAAVVFEECSKNNIQHVIDFGSGLGYVDRILSQAFGLRVLGLEQSDEKVRKAQNEGGNVEYKQAFISKNTLLTVKKQITDWLQGSSACFIALHACGDLSVYVGELFAEIEEGKCLVLIPCCYHISKTRPLTEDVKKRNIVNINLLRLACDSTSDHWREKSEEDLAHLSRSVLARALLELFPSQENTGTKKKFRHLFRHNATSDWDKCLEVSLERFSGVDRDKLAQAWKSNEWRINQIKAYSCLQTCLQGVAEGLVLADTFLFLRSILNVNVSIRLKRIVDVLTSPRSISFIINR